MEKWRLIYKPDIDPKTEWHWKEVIWVLNDAKVRGELKELKPTVTLMEFKQPFISLGYYQDVDKEVFVDKCKQYDVPITRRWGAAGATIFCDVGWSYSDIICPLSLVGDLDGAFRKFIGEWQFGNVRRLGVPNIEFVFPNDIRVSGKKIVGSAALVSEDRALLQVFLNRLFPPNMDISLEVMNIPAAKFKDKAIKEFKSYVGSVETDGSEKIAPPLEVVKDAVIKTTKEVFGTELVEEGLTDEEKEVWDKYVPILTSEEFIFRNSTKKFLTRMPADCKYGYHEEKFKKLCQISAAVAPDGIIKDLAITGDMFLSPFRIDEELAERLKNLRYSDKAEMLKRVEDLLSKPGYAMVGLTAEELVSVVSEAGKKALEP